VNSEPRKIELNPLQRCRYYAIVSFFLVAPITIIYYWVKGAGENPELKDGWVVLANLILAVFFLIAQTRKLRFSVVKIHCDEDQFQEVVNRTVQDLEWRTERKEKSYVRAHRPSNWTGSWGEMITLIRLDDKLLVNSICDPDKYISTASYGWNRRNIQIFIAHLHDVLNGEPLLFRNPDRTKSPNARYIRVFAYFFSLLFIGIGIISFMNGVWTLGTLLVGLALGYFYMDLWGISNARN
jgi:hypothetical protein